MNRNTNSRFSIAPQVDIQRSTFKRDSSVKTSFDVGQLIPFYVDEVLAGDTFKVKTSKVCRMQTLKTPMMDDIFIDTYYFFCPSRILWDHFVNFFGENGDSAWIPEVEYTIPQITAPSGGWNVGTIADYLGIPIGVDNISVNALPFRAVARVYNEWFRDENLMDPLVIESGDSTVSGSNGSSYVTDVALGGLPPVACKTHDYFTSALPAPQKGPAVSIPLVGAGVLPVFPQGSANEYFAPLGSSSMERKVIVRNAYPIGFTALDNDPTDYGIFLTPNGMTSGDSTTGAVGAILREATSSNGYSGAFVFKDDGGTVPKDLDGLTLSEVSTGLASPYTNHKSLTPVNLVADASGIFQATTINDLRQAFQIQRYFEKCARGGTRFRELLQAHFGTSLGDVRAMIPEYLGGNRLNVNVRQITQTSSTTSESPMGDVAGMSVTTDTHFDFEKSFTEPGYIIGFMVARYHHTYQQGIDPLFQRKGIFDFYWPTLAHLGEMPIKNRTIFAQGFDPENDEVDVDNQVFGYQEAWAEYRYKPNRVSGLMRSAANGSLDTWHFADYYTELPYLSADWIMEDKNNVDRVLTVSSAISNQIFADIFVENRTTRPMPLFSIPGLIDHF